MQLHHLALGAQDVEALAQFYASAFGLRECARHHHDDESVRSIWLELDPGVLMIEHVESAARTAHMERGLFLIAFQVSDDDRAGAEQRVTELGAVVEERGDNTTYFRDPEGNRVALSRYRF